MRTISSLIDTTAAMPIPRAANCASRATARIDKAVAFYEAAWHGGAHPDLRANMPADRNPGPAFKAAAAETFAGFPDGKGK